MVSSWMSGRARRLATGPQRSALGAMRRTCAIGGCDQHVDRCPIHHLTEWDDFKWLDLDKLAETMADKNIVDARNILELCDRAAADPIAKLLVLTTLLVGGTYFPVETLPAWLRPVGELHPIQLAGIVARRIDAAFPGLNLTSRADALKVEGPEESAELIRGILAGKSGPARDIVVANAAAALSVTRAGAQASMPSRSEVDAFLSRQ